MKIATMFTNPRVVALNEVSMICQQLQDRYESDLDLLEQSGLQRAASERSEQLQQSRQALEAEVRALGDLPRATDPDQETLTDLVDHAAALLSDLASDSSAQVVVDALVEHEQKLEKQAVEALAQSFNEPLSCPATDQLEAIVVQAQAMQRRLDS